MFMLFTGHNYYPSGGWSDFRGFFVDRKDARRIAKNHRGDWYQIVGATDEGTTGIVESGNIKDLIE